MSKLSIICAQDSLLVTSRVHRSAGKTMMLTLVTQHDMRQCVDGTFSISLLFHSSNVTAVTDEQSTLTIPHLRDKTRAANPEWDVVDFKCGPEFRTLFALVWKLV